MSINQLLNVTFLSILFLINGMLSLSAEVDDHEHDHFGHDMHDNEEEHVNDMGNDSGHIHDDGIRKVKSEEQKRKEAMVGTIDLNTVDKLYHIIKNKGKVRVKWSDEGLGDVSYYNVYGYEYEFMKDTIPMMSVRTPSFTNVVGTAKPNPSFTYYVSIVRESANREKIEGEKVRIDVDWGDFVDLGIQEPQVVGKELIIEADEAIVYIDWEVENSDTIGYYNIYDWRRNLIKKGYDGPDSMGSPLKQSYYKEIHDAKDGYIGPSPVFLFYISSVNLNDEEGPLVPVEFTWDDYKGQPIEVVEKAFVVGASGVNQVNIKWKVANRNLLDHFRVYNWAGEVIRDEKGKPYRFEEGNLNTEIRGMKPEVGKDLVYYIASVYLDSTEREHEGERYPVYINVEDIR